MQNSVFLEAEWRCLAMVNYRIDPQLLEPLVPLGTELDFFRDETYVSIVGFLFLKTKVLGWSFPFHRDFEEVNLRFYVRRREAGVMRRGAVFVQEVVPRFAIAATARRFYNENYFARRMGHTIDHTNGGVRFEVRWKFSGANRFLKVEAEGEPGSLVDGSHEQFIADHYWGYSKQTDGSTVEYQVSHPSWRIWEGCRYELNIDAREQYGERFESALLAGPASVFLAEGSAVTVSKGRRLG